MIVTDQLRLIMRIIESRASLREGIATVSFIILIMPHRAGILRLIVAHIAIARAPAGRLVIADRKFDHRACRRARTELARRLRDGSRAAPAIAVERGGGCFAAFTISMSANDSVPRNHAAARCGSAGFREFCRYSEELTTLCEIG